MYFRGCAWHNIYKKAEGGRFHGSEGSLCKQAGFAKRKRTVHCAKENFT